MCVEYMPRTARVNKLYTIESARARTRTCRDNILATRKRDWTRHRLVSVFFFSGPLEMRGPSTRRAAYENLSLAGDSHCNAFQFVRFHHTSSPCTPCFAIEPTHTHTRRHWPRQYGQVIHLDVVAVTARRRTPLYGLSLSLHLSVWCVCVF